MKPVKRMWSRTSNFVTGQSGEQRLREEMEEHIAMQTEENLRAGMSAAEARRQALIKWGATETVREQYHAEKRLPGIVTFSCLYVDGEALLHELDRVLAPGHVAGGGQGWIFPEE